MFHSTVGRLLMVGVLAVLLTTAAGVAPASADSDTGAIVAGMVVGGLIGAALSDDDDHGCGPRVYHRYPVPVPVPVPPPYYGGYGYYGPGRSYSSGYRYGYRQAYGSDRYGGYQGGYAYGRYGSPRGGCW